MSSPIKRLQHTLRGALAALLRRRRWEEDLDAELAAHLAHRAADLERTGLEPRQAARQARLELGPAEAWKERCRTAQGLRWPDELRQDARYAVRMLLHSPGFTAVAVLSLTLGIGANTVVFSVLNSLLLRPLPIAAPQAVYTVNGGHSFPNYVALRDRNTAFAGLAAYRIAPMGIQAEGATQRVWGYLATGNYFDVLGVRPLLGRFFHAEEDRQVGASPYAVLSYAAWRSRFGGDSQIAGRTVRINGQPYTILGVAPPGFHGTELFYWPEVWVPMMMQPQIEGHSWLDAPASFNCQLVGRLRPGVSVARATANLAALANDLAHEQPKWNDRLVLGLAQPGLLGDQLRSPMRAFAGGVMLLATLVLLAACANLANLLAARSADRQRELAIRLSIGAGRARVLRQLLVESAILALAGGAAGYALAATLLRLLSHWRAPLDFPVQFEVDPDWRVILFALGVSLVTGMLFSFAPASQALRADPNEMLKGNAGAGAGAGVGGTGRGKARHAARSPELRERGSRPDRRSQRAARSVRRPRSWALRDLLLPVQVAACALLLTACLVALRGLGRILEAPLGFSPGRVAVVGFDLGLAGYPPDRAAEFERRAVAAVQALPGVAAASWGNSVPLSIDQSSNTAYPQGTADFRLSSGYRVSHYEVAPGYFAALGTRLLAGREFTWHDDAQAPHVAIVNLTFVRRVLGLGGIGGSDGSGGSAGALAVARAAVGRRFLLGQRDPVEVAGVVEDGKYVSLTEQPALALFESVLQQPNRTAVVVALSRGPAAPLAQEMRAALAALDPNLPLYGTGSLQQMLGLALLPARTASIALGAFGLLAAMLAVTGVYGLAAYAVSRRRREIGIRLAIGASGGHLLRLLLGRTALLVAAGSLAGLALAAASARILASVVPFASSRDPLTLLGAIAAMGLIGCAAAFVPARRALRVDPVEALRRD